MPLLALILLVADRRPLFLRPLRQGTGKKHWVHRARSISALQFSEVAKQSVSARPGPILGGTLGSRTGPGRAGMAPTSGRVPNTVKQSTWRIWTGHLGPGMGPGRAQDRTQARVWMAPLRDSNRLPGLSEISFCGFWLNFDPLIKGRQTGGVSNGGFSRSGLVLPFLSFLGLSRFFRDFPDLLGDGPGIFPTRPFSLSRPIKSTYEEQSRKGPRHNLDLSRNKWETPGFGTPPV